eukprot:CAMPEP_0197443370 /NCGR_PEP_ID=MMETSP1175-20131217/9118_1 /TAXON_ID=1003142 /ORGANISM="Triceratium dubium, Strain CCMP147" /LENGTH=49 /DNA_ID= /DNA_START= /DNA_END= /DNA_ORIENTATION=
MYGAVQRRAEDVRHARVELEEGMTSLPGRRHLVLDGTDQRSGHGDQVRA